MTTDAPVTTAQRLDALAHPFPGNRLLHIHNMEEGESENDSPEQAARETWTEVTDLDQAMVVTSRTYLNSSVRYDATGRHDLGEFFHRPVLDLDMNATLTPSSTPGHFHLMIDKGMTWARYVDLLDALEAAGILEPGYVSASKARGFTAVRVPWFRKGDPAAYVLDETSGELVKQGDAPQADVSDPWAF